MEWQVKKLGDVCRLINGRAYKKHEMLSEGKYPLLRVGNFFSNRSWYYSDLELDDDKYCDKGDLLYAWSASFGPRVWDGSKVIYHYHIWKIELNHGLVDKKYLFHLLDWDTEQIKAEQGTGSTMLHVTKGAMENRLLPFPTISEQKRIVAILDEIFADIEQVRAKTEQNLKNARELFESYLQQVFNQRGEGWVEKTLGDAVIVERGSSPRPIKNFQTDSDDGVNWIKIGDAKEGQKYIVSTREKITKEGAMKSRFVDVGDFILSNSMSFGRPYIMAIPGYIHDGWFVLRLPNDIDSNYFYYLLSSPYVREQFKNLAAGAIVKNISGDLVKKVILPLPSLAEQKKIAEKLKIFSLQVESLKGIYNKKSEHVDELKKSILQKAFSGELTQKNNQGAVA